MELIALYILITISVVVTFLNRRKVSSGSIITKGGQPYLYLLGDYLKSDTGSFHGLDVLLPYQLVDFYLDSHKDSKRRGPTVLFDRHQKISLEGDFDKYFQLFAPVGSATDVLSILSPDVMQTLITSSQRYDVELSGNHLRIISNTKVYPTIGKDQLIQAAEAIIAELDQRAKSWQPQPGTISKLGYRKGITVKFAGLYLRRSSLLWLIFSLLLGIVVSGFGLALYYTRQNPTFSDPYSKGIFAGTLIYAAAIIFLIAIPIVMLGPIIWFFSSHGKPRLDIFPGR